MVDTENFEQRLQQLDWTLYKLAKDFAELRARRAGEKEVPPASRYHTSIGKAIENPATSRLETIQDIVQVLNGELTIIWDADRVVKIRLEDKTIEALQQRAENEGKTINEVAKQLLLQALSGLPLQKPKQLTDLVIDKEASIYRSFPPAIASAYSAVHQWLAERAEAKGYKELDYSKDIARSLDKSDLKDTAFQFYALFPRYYFEAAHTLDNVIDSTKLLNRLKYNPRICFIDIGCAMGAASAAWVERILAWQKDNEISHSLEIVCLAIDPSIYGITVYSKLMQEIQQAVKPFKINLDFQPICESFPKGMMTAMRYLQTKRKTWEQPVLSNLLLMQLDIASAVSQEELLKKEQYQKLKDLGLEPDLILSSENEFWQEEVLSYKQLLEEAPVENLHIGILGTKSLKKHINQTLDIDSSDRFKEIKQNIEKVIGEDHKITGTIDQQQEVTFNNPLDSYWHDNNSLSHSSSFQALSVTIKNKELKDNWSELIDLKNLELAWSRARKNLLSEFLYDEIEIRLFEMDLRSHLQDIQQNLIDYCYWVDSRKEAIAANLPKGGNSSRPKQLSRLEEEILANAIIQVISEKFDIDFYSYKPKEKSYENEDEYLYESWWDNYRNFKKEVESCAKRNKEGMVLQTDIKSYYTNIEQDKLLDIVTKGLERDGQSSSRIEWLLKKLIYHDLSYSNNKQVGEKVGLNQGTITSGFYANLYLVSLDKKFEEDKQLNIDYYRYVDDIIIISPHADSKFINKLKSVLDEELKILGLKRSLEKTIEYDKTEDFLEVFLDDQELESLGNSFTFTIYKLWLMNSEYRTKFRFAHHSDEEDLWWNLIKSYQQSLFSINIYFTEHYLSRKIYQSIFKNTESRRDELLFPSFPNNTSFQLILAWKKQFKTLARNWLEEKDKLKNDIVGILHQSIEILEDISEKEKNTSQLQNIEETRSLKIEKRKQEKRIRFAVNKLAILGFDDVWVEIINLIINKNIIRNLSYVIVTLARQGHTEAIAKLREHYECKQDHASEYLRAVILEAMRFLPSLNIQDWEFIFKCAIEGKSDIERLKATESWLYLSNIAKDFVQTGHIQSVSNILETQPEILPRIKKNYILLLGVHDPELLNKVQLSEQEQKDYLIKDSINLAISGKVSKVIEQNEPAILRQYYSLKISTSEEEEDKKSL